MKIIEDIISTILGHSGEIYDDNEDTFSTDEKEKGNSLGCEQTIVKCQMKHGRLMPSTSRACEIKYGKDTTRKAKSRLAMRKKRGKCEIKANRKQMLEALKPLWDSYFTQKQKDNFKGAL